MQCMQSCRVPHTKARASEHALSFAALSTGGAGSPAVRSAPRDVVLDRYEGHTLLCPDSLGAYRSLQTAQSVFSITTVLGSAALVSFAAAASATGTLQGGLIAKYASLQLCCAPCTLRKCQTFKFCTFRSLLSLN